MYFKNNKLEVVVSATNGPVNKKENVEWILNTEGESTDSKPKNLINSNMYYKYRIEANIQYIIFNSLLSILIYSDFI